MQWGTSIAFVNVLLIVVGLVPTIMAVPFAALSEPERM